jgi:hypothetical protein
VFRGTGLWGAVHCLRVYFCLCVFSWDWLTNQIWEILKDFIERVLLLSFGTHYNGKVNATKSWECIFFLAPGSAGFEKVRATGLWSIECEREAPLRTVPVFPDCVRIQVWGQKCSFSLGPKGSPVLSGQMACRRCWRRTNLGSNMESRVSNEESRGRVGNILSLASKRVHYWSFESLSVFVFTVSIGSLDLVA